MKYNRVLNGVPPQKRYVYVLITRTYQCTLTDVIKGLKIVGKNLWLVNKTQDSVTKTKILTSAEGYATAKDLVSKHTEWEVHLGFYP
jgi:hypothetical protein